MLAIHLAIPVVPFVSAVAVQLLLRTTAFGVCRVVGVFCENCIISSKLCSHISSNFYGGSNLWPNGPFCCELGTSLSY